VVTRGLARTWGTTDSSSSESPEAPPALGQMCCVNDVGLMRRLRRSRFHPHVQSSGQIMIDGQVIDAKGEAMFVAAIQGLRPDAVSPSRSDVDSRPCDSWLTLTPPRSGRLEVELCILYDHPGIRGRKARKRQGHPDGIRDP